MKRPGSIGSRLSWLFALLTLAGLGAVSLSIYAAMAINLRAQAADELAQRAAVLLHVLGEAAPPADLALLRHKLADFATGQRDLEVAVDVPGSGAFFRSAPLPAAAGATTLTGAYEAAAPQPGTRLLLRLDTTSTERLLHLLAVALAVACAAGTAVVSLGGFWLVRAGLAPLHTLARDLRSVSAERLGQSLAAPAHAQELAPVIAQFNALMQRLDAAYRQLEGFNADVAHELRTPLATLISRCELDLAPGRSAEQLRDGIAANLEELQRLAAIVKDMLFLSRADRGARARLGAPASLAAEAARVVAFHDAAIEEAGLTVELAGDALRRFDTGLVRRALSNLLSNAVRHAAPGSTVVVRIAAHDDGPATLAVENRGETIAPADLSRLFDRFFRADAAREHGAERHGLGLAIVAAIARMHGGEPFARSHAGRTEVGFVLGAAPAQAAASACAAPAASA